MDSTSARADTHDPATPHAPPRGRPQVSAVVLAGGRSSRFGSDKSRASFAGTSVLERVLGTVEGLRRLRLVDDILVVGEWGPPGTRVELEPERFQGPVAGLAHGLAASDADVALVLAADHPLLSPGLLELLVERALSTPDADAVVPVGPDGPEPLVACYRRSVGPVAARRLGDGRRSLRGLLDELSVEWIGRRVWARVDHAGASFLDVDTPDDLAALGGGASGPEG